MSLPYVNIASETLLGGVYMDRRGFVKVLLQGGMYLPFMPIVAAAKPARNVIVQQSAIAGFLYYEGERQFSRLRLDTPLSLLRDAENKYDRDSVAVYFHRHKLDFVPKADNTAVAQMLDRGKRLSARIVRLEQSRSPWERIRFEVVLDG